MNKVLHSRYHGIKKRCYNQNSHAYYRYGGRGIKMCQEWLDDYFAFEKWALENGFEPSLAIDRIDNDGDYSPENCRFITLRENNQNRGTSLMYTIDGVTKNLQQWADEYGVKRSTVETRLKHGWTIEDALKTPIRKRDKTSLIGEKFGRLTVIKYAGDKYAHKSGRNSWWECRCDCGNITTVKDCKLKGGHTKSCGCSHIDAYQRRRKP